ncbi:MAG: hypothetical protein ABH826_03210 [Patescibacteria group bacterium]|nr:hypothetical protein [Patescibacteria group bacterium]
MKRLIFAIFAIVLLIPAQNAHAEFNPNYLISDWDLKDAFSMGFNEIQHYLERGALADYKTEDWQGATRYAADIILRAAQDNSISPKFLLVLLQKEQSLVEDDTPTDRQLDWATGYAVCDDCSKDDPSIQRWKGFGKQVNSAAMQFSEGYMADIETTGSTQGKYGPGLKVEVDGQIVVPENAATAALYAYTPHFQGNANFVSIWDRWFGFQHPTGTLLKISNQPGIYLIEYGYKRPIHSWSAFLSRFNPDLIIEVPEHILDAYTEGRPIDFPNYSLLQDEDGSIYLLVDDALRHIDSMETFHKIGFMEDEIVSIKNNDLVYFDEGEPITSITAHPEGVLMQLRTSGTVFYIENGVRHIIIDKIIQNTRFSNRTPILVDPVEVEQFKEGTQVTLPDGYLIKTAADPTVYILAEGQRQAIPSESVFLSYGYSWNDILTLSESALNAHPLGPALEEL